MEISLVQILLSTFQTLAECWTLEIQKWISHGPYPQAAHRKGSVRPSGAMLKEKVKEIGEGKLHFFTILFN